MNDLIYRQMAIDALGERPMVWVESDYELGAKNQYDSDVFALKTVPSAQQSDRDTDVPIKQPGWILCSDQLPYAEYGESDTVLATCGYRDVEDTSVRWVRLLYFNGGVWCYPTGECYEENVYAWMPVPKPYKGEENNGT